MMKSASCCRSDCARIAMLCSTHYSSQGRQWPRIHMLRRHKWPSSWWERKVGWVGHCADESNFHFKCEWNECFWGTTSHKVISQMTSCLSHADTNINARVNNKRNWFDTNLQIETATINNVSHVNQTVQLQESKLLQSNSCRSYVPKQVRLPSVCGLSRYCML